MIEKLEFDFVISTKFAANLKLITENMSRILGEMVKLYYVERISGCAELATRLEEKDPLKIDVSNFYRFNIKKFLRAVALGLRPSEEWNCRNEAEGGCIVVKRNAEIVLYPLRNYDDFETYLLNNTRLDTPDPNRHNFGKISGGGGFLHRPQLTNSFQVKKYRLDQKIFGGRFFFDFNQSTSLRIFSS